MSTTPPGWYDDGSGTQRWWDGEAWTDQVQAGSADDSPPAAEAGSAAPAEPGSPPAAEALAGLDPAAAAAAGIAPTGATPDTPGYPAHAASGAPVGAYPGGFPGEPAAGAAEGRATYQEGSPQPAAKSKLWIVFAVLGVLVVALIVLAAVFIPRLIGQITGGGSPAGSDAERAAVEVVERYDDAWDDADCDLYFETTTEGYRQALGMTDCAAFESTAEVFDESTDEYEIEVDTVEQTGENITVLTTERYLSLVDENGDPLPTPDPIAEPLQYTLVPAAGGWAIDNVQ